MERVPTGFHVAPCSALRASRSTLERAFTRAELLVILAVLALLALVVLPALANNRPRSARVICGNNLRQIGMGFQLWGNDHNDTLPQEVPVLQGGTMQHALAPNVWLHLAWLSNEVVTPKIFLCPSDTGQPASDFTGSPAGGYLHANFRNGATTYFLGYTGILSLNNAAEIVAGDRNVATAGVSGCSRFNTALVVPRPPTAIARWTDGLHGTAGNVLSYDGRVQQLDSAGLNSMLNSRLDDNGSKHIITPR
jgi:competence protein ComGC